MSLFRNYRALSVSRMVRRKLGQRRHSELVKRNDRKQVLVVLHLFYPESWKEIREYLFNLEPYRWHLVVTMPESTVSTDHASEIVRDFPDATVMLCPNRGYDIAPFIYALKNMPDLNQYDVVIKLQSKGIKRRVIYIYDQLFLGRDWMLDLFEGVVGADTVHLAIEAIVNNSKVGVVCASNLIVRDPPHKRHITQRVMAEKGLDFEPDYRFVAGTCFAMKPCIARKIASIPFEWKDFEPLQNSGTLSFAHVLERYFGMLPQKMDLVIKGLRVRVVPHALRRPVENVLHRLSSERLYELPYAYDDEFFMWQLDNKIVRWKIKKVRVGDLFYQPNINMEPVPIKDCFPYRYLTGNREDYGVYCEQNKELDRDAPIMSEKRFKALIDSVDVNGFDSKRIIIVNTLGAIMDGQHRACVLAYKNGLDYPIDVLELLVINKHGLLKLIFPKSVLRNYSKVMQRRSRKDDSY